MVTGGVSLAEVVAAPLARSSYVGRWDGSVPRHALIQVSLRGATMMQQSHKSGKAGPKMSGYLPCRSG